MRMSWVAQRRAGQWVPTSVVSWVSDGGPNPGAQGGTLVMNVNFNFSFGLTLPASVTIICPFVNGAFQESDDAALVTLLDEEFVTPLGGLTVFHKLSR